MDLELLRARQRMLLVMWCLVLPIMACQDKHSREQFDTVILGGRVMDPESGLDAIRNVGILAGTVAAISKKELNGKEVIQATGLVVSPGFIDLHVHGQDLVSNRFQAADGVTTALELELGVYPVPAWYASREGKALINYGASVGHLAARLKLMQGVDVGHLWNMSAERRRQLTGKDYAYRRVNSEEMQALVKLLQKGLEEGGLGIGLGITYVPGATHQEILHVFQAAAKSRVPVFVHLRSPQGYSDKGVIGPFQEVISNAATTGASLHIVHLNSSADELAKICLEIVRGAQTRGIDVTTEAYPYTAGSTRLESALFDNWKDYQSLQWVETGERLNEKTFEAYRRQGGWVIIHGRSEEMNEWIVSQPDVIAASDGIPFIEGRAHPRGAGTFSRILGYYSRERQVLSLMEAIRKMTLLPAQRLESMVPQMKKKGRLKVGVDADLTLFDPKTVLDNATYEEPNQYSSGIIHVLVDGVSVIKDSKLVEGVLPGRPILSQPYSAH